ncbi:MAG: InlB B-repeat-containing protein [Alphaproteobacteria bacterium]
MMKPVNRIFLILGAMSMFSLFQFDAMGKCTNNPEKGKFCKGSVLYTCRQGCYCTGTSEEGVGTIDVKKACEDGDSDKEEKLNKAGVFYCGQGKTSPEGASSIGQCFNKNDVSDDTPKDCNSVDAGRYCWHKDDKEPCPAGCYCDGGRNVLAVEKFYTNKTSVEKACALRTLTSMSGSGVHLCPSGTTSNPAGGGHGAKESSDCFRGLTAWDGSQNCTTAAPKGQYCRHKDVLKEDCAPGCYCEGGKNAIGDNDEEWGQVTSACENHWSNDVKGYLEARGVKYCPNSFPKSVTKAESKDDCYFEENNERRYYRDYKDGIEVDAGYYLPKSKTTPTSCENLTGLAVCLGGRFVPSAASNVGITYCADGKIPNSNRSDCVSRYAVTYNCNGGTGTAPTDSNSPYLVGATVTVKSNTCTAQPGRTFDKWNCGNIIGDKTPTQTFSMPSANVICIAKWKSAGDNGGGTQGGGTQGGDSNSCQPGQYWKITAEARVDTTAVRRDTAGAGSCTDCEAGYYCPDKEHKYPCTGDTYTDRPRQTQCLPCNGTVTYTGNLNTGCSTDPDNPGDTTYTVTYNCGDHGTGDLSNNGASHTSGTQVTTLASTACTRNEGYTFSNWKCMAGNTPVSVDNAGQFTMPSSNVTCTAQWSTSGNGNGGGNGNAGGNGNGGGNGNENEDAVCPVGQYLPADGEDANDCEQCSGNYVCPGDDASYRCPWTVSGNTCGGILDAGQLKKGKSRNRDCWKFFNSPSDYRECVYGFSID